MPIPIMAFETGIPLEGASKALQCTIEAGFCKYDHDAEVVWIPEMARFQIAKQLHAGDKQIKGIQSDIIAMGNMPFINEFLSKYGTAFGLKIEGALKPLESPLEAPSKPLALALALSPAIDNTPQPPEGGEQKKVRSRKSYDAEFEQFWETTRFPKKEQDDKGGMFKKYSAAIKAGLTAAEIATAADAFADGNADNQFPIGMRRFLEPMTIREWLSRTKTAAPSSFVVSDERLKRHMEKIQAQQQVRA
jgi:hypothetical protein